MSETSNTTYKQWLQALAYLYIQQRQPGNAITLLEALLVLDPVDLQANKMLALAYLHNKQYQASLKAVDFLLADERTQKNNASLWLIRAKALWALKQTDAARQALRKHYDGHSHEHNNFIDSPISDQENYEQQNPNLVE